MPMMGGYGMMGQMPMMGSGMMGSQMPMMGGWGGMQVLRRDLTADEVKHMMQHRLAWSGNQNVKLGNVSEKEGDVIEVEITDKDGKVVQKLKVDRHTGCPSSKSLGRLSLFLNGGPGSPWIYVKPLVVDGSSGGSEWFVS